ncbi:MAG: septal ring lytic transglycosylase RlpA family protein [Thermodesulfobacteriota bacterium]
MKRLVLLAGVMLAAGLAGCSTHKPAALPPATSLPPPSLPSRLPPTTGRIPATQRPYVIDGRTYYPLPSAVGYVEEGVASWYGEPSHGRRTACGEVYDMYGPTVAHKTLPMHTPLLIQNLDNGLEMVARVNDRGPFVKERVVDLSYGVARELGVVARGTARVRIAALGEGIPPGAPGGAPQLLPPPDFDRGEFYIQVGAFVESANAERLRAQLAGAGSQAVIERYDRGDQVFFRVQVYAGRHLAAAREAEVAWSGAGYPQAFVVAR